MALFGAGKQNNGRELRIYENSDELSIAFAEYIAEISEAAVKDRGIFAIALSGGSLISLMRKTENYVESRITRLLIGLNGTYFGSMNVWWQKITKIVITSLQRMGC